MGEDDRAYVYVERLRAKINEYEVEYAWWETCSDDSVVILKMLLHDYEFFMHSHDADEVKMENFAKHIEATIDLYIALIVRR